LSINDFFGIDFSFIVEWEGNNDGLERFDSFDDEVDDGGDDNDDDEGSADDEDDNNDGLSEDKLLVGVVEIITIGSKLGILELLSSKSGENSNKGLSKLGDFPKILPFPFSVTFFFTPSSFSLFLFFFVL
jgi:hypothetical protein